MMKRWMRVFSLVPAVALLLAIAACSDSNGPGKTDFEVVQEAVAAWIATNPPSTVAPSAVYDDIVAHADASTRSYLPVSVRTASAYALGHVAGAINIPWREVTLAANASALNTDKTLAVYCYTGHTAGLAAGALSILGYDVANMKFGMMGWSDDPTIVGTTIWSESDCLGAATETTANLLTTTVYDFPDLEVSASSVEATILKAAVDRWLTDTDFTPLMSAQAVFDILNDGNAANDPLVISVRASAVYDLGHVPGAINLTNAQLTDPEVLKHLDPTRDIVVYCYTGHSAGQATALLNTLGYTTYNMKFGMMAWSSDADIRGTTPFTTAAGYPTVASASY